MSGAATDFLDKYLAGSGKAPVPQPEQSAGLSTAATDFLDQYLAQTRAETAPEPPPAPSHPVSGPTGDLLKDAARIAGTTGTNLLAGFVSTPNLVAQGVDWLGGRVGLNPGAQAALESVPTPGRPNTPMFPNPEQAKEMAYNTTGATEFQPESWLGRRGMDALSGLALGPLGGMRSIPAMVGGSVTAGAAAEEAAKRGYSPLVASMLGFIPGAYVGRKLANAVLPAAGGTLPVEDARLANAAIKDYGIPLSAGDLSNNLALKILKSEGGDIPFSGARQFADRQQAALGRSVMGTFGENAPRMTPEVLKSARQRIGSVFEGVGARTSIPMDNELLGNLQGVIDTAKRITPAHAHDAIEAQAMNIIDTAANNGGNIGGRAYIKLTARGGPIDQMINSPDPSIAEAGKQYRTVIDNALQAHAAPEDLAALATARREYRAFMTAREMAKRADTIGGANPSVGEVSPAALRQAVNKGYPNAIEQSVGEVPLNDLARIGQRFLKEPGSSNTGLRLLAQKAIAGGTPLVGAMLGGAGGAALGIEPTMATLAGVAAPLVVNRLAQSLMRSQPIASRMIARSLNPNGFQFTAPTALQRALLPPALVRSQNPTPPTP